MAAGRCSRFQPDLSAFADGTLSPKRWEQVCYHLAGCEDCRAEVAEISRVCSTLSSCSRTGAPESLTARLEQIAGEHAEAPLYMSAGDGDLPSSRRRRTKWAAQGSAALLAVMASVVVLAILIAPEPVRLADPVGTAREQYSMSTSAISVNEAVGAVLLAYQRGADLGAPVSYEPRALGEAVPISPERAAAVLRTSAETDLTLSGVQRVWISDGAGLYHSADVRTRKVVGEGAQLEVFDARGSRFLSSFVPEFATRPVKAPEAWEFLESRESVELDGRQVNQLIAVGESGKAASWWVDVESGLLLWSERYDAMGGVSIAVGYTDLDLGSAQLDDANLTQLIALQPASSSQERGWCRGLPRCPQEVGGLPLVAYSSSERDGQESMNLVYSDGFDTAVVVWTEGLLDDGVTAQTDRTAGMPTVALWQWGDGVVSVTTSGSPSMLRDITEALPDEEPYAPSVLDRATTGLGRLVGLR